MATIVAVLHLELHIPQARSLKDKRRILKSFKDRLANGHNVSVAEVAGQGHHRYSTVAIAMVANEKRYVEGAMQQIVNAASAHRDMILTDHELQWL